MIKTYAQKSDVAVTIFLWLLHIKLLRHHFLWLLLFGQTVYFPYILVTMYMLSKNHCCSLYPHAKTFNLTPNKTMFWQFWKPPKIHTRTFSRDTQNTNIDIKSVLINRFSKTKKFQTCWDLENILQPKNHIFPTYI